MSTLVVADLVFQLSRDGRLLDLSEWTMEVAEALATGDSLTLTEQHWEIIDFLRVYYRKFGTAPNPEILKIGLTQRFGPAKATDEYLARLFPADVLLQGAKIAGIPAPESNAQFDGGEQVVQSMEEEIDEECCPWQFEFESKLAG